MPKTNIQIDKQTRDDLVTEGKFGETYDTLIQRLLKELAAWRNGRTKKGG